MHTDPWGVKVATVEVKYIDLPQEMQRAMAKQTEAERERLAKIINSEGEFQSAQKLVQAAENNSTMLFPMPLDLFTPFLKMAQGSSKDTNKVIANSGWC